MPTSHSVPPAGVSIIVPVYNAQATLARTLDSIKNQSLRDIEVLCIDDCSTDASLQMLEDYALRDRRFVVRRQPKNMGVAAARNAGIAAATGHYLCFLDADDWWAPEKLARQLDHMEAGGDALSYMSYRRVAEDGALLKDMLPPDNVSYEQLLCTNHIGNLTAMVSRKIIVENDIRFEKLGHEDYLFWLNVLKVVSQGRLVQSPTPLCFYLVRKGSLSSNKIKTAKWQWFIYREKIGMNFWLASRYFACYLSHAVFKRVL